MFSDLQRQQIKLELELELDNHPSSMFTERQWISIYCQTMNLTVPRYSNLHIDINECGHGREMKVLGVRSIDAERVMHPSITRSIRIEDGNGDASSVMCAVFAQYRDYINGRIASVKATAIEDIVNLSYGVLLYQKDMTKFAYFETPMSIPDPADYYAVWHPTRKNGIRKPSRSLWIYEKATDKKQYSITTSAGVKVQKYFDVIDQITFELSCSRV
jgi:hypothetical protein